MELEVGMKWRVLKITLGELSGLLLIDPNVSKSTDEIVSPYIEEGYFVEDIGEVCGVATVIAAPEPDPTQI